MKLIAMIVTAASPEIRLALCDFVKELKVKAESTPNPWDDILAGLLEVILMCKDD